MQIRNFSEPLEQDFQRLKATIDERRRESPSVPEAGERLVVKRSLEQMAQTIPAPSRRETGAAPAAAPAGAPSGVLPAYLQKGDEPEAIKREVARLVDFTFAHGIAAAIKESKQHSAFVQDAFHDTLIDNLMPELERRGML